LSIDREVAPETEKERTEVCPEVVDAGVAVKEFITGAGGRGGATVVKVKSAVLVEFPKESIEVTWKW